MLAKLGPKEFSVDVMVYVYELSCVMFQWKMTGPSCVMGLHPQVVLLDVQLASMF